MKINNPVITPKYLIEFCNKEFDWIMDDSKYAYHDDYWKILKSNGYDRMNYGDYDFSDDEMLDGPVYDFFRSLLPSKLMKIKQELQNILKNEPKSIR